MKRLLITLNYRSLRRSLLGLLLTLLIMSATAIAQSFTQLKEQADNGDATAQLKLGKAYDFGYDVPKNEIEAARWYGKAIPWYRRAAEQGNADAQLNLGWAYEFGKGIAKDKAEAARWYGKAADWYRKAAERGDAKAQYQLGQMYDNGRGLPVDRNEAARWFRKAADQGDAQAQLVLGVIFSRERNYQDAARWFSRAAEQGNADAQYQLGVAYYFGAGVPKDEAEAVRWYRKAAEQGNTQAQAKLGSLSQGVQKDQANPAQPKAQKLEEPTVENLNRLLDESIGYHRRNLAIAQNLQIWYEQNPLGLTNPDAIALRKEFCAILLKPDPSEHIAAVLDKKPRDDERLKKAGVNAKIQRDTALLNQYLSAASELRGMGLNCRDAN